MAKLKTQGVITPEEYQQAELAGTLTIAKEIVCSYCQDPVEIQDPLQFHCQRHGRLELRMYDNPGYPAVVNEYYGTMMFYFDVIREIPLRRTADFSHNTKAARSVTGICPRRRETLILSNSPFLVISVACRFVSGLLSRRCVFNPNRNISSLGMRPMSR